MVVMMVLDMFCIQHVPQTRYIKYRLVILDAYYNNCYQALYTITLIVTVDAFTACFPSNSIRSIENTHVVGSWLIPDLQIYWDCM